MRARSHQFAQALSQAHGAMRGADRSRDPNPEIETLVQRAEALAPRTAYPMVVTGWKRVRRTVRAAVVRGFIRALMRLPLSLATAIGAALGRAVWVFSSRLRRDMRASLSIAFPEKTITERDAIARASLVHLG